MDYRSWFQYCLCSDIILDATIRVSENAVSRQHIQLRIDNDYSVEDPKSIPKITITDLKTKHGTKWNNARISFCICSA